MEVSATEIMEITDSAEEGWPVGLKGSQRLRYILPIANYTAIEEMTMTEILRSD